MTETKFEECIIQICQGNRNGLKEIYEAYFSYIYKVIYGILQNKENTEDMTADFFLKLWRIAPSYQAGNGHKGFMATIARNMALDFLRKNKREILNEEIGEEMGSETIESAVVDRISIEKALQVLKPDERLIIHIKVMEGLTYREIAEALQMPIGTVTWKYQEAIKKLRRLGYES